MDDRGSSVFESDALADRAAIGTRVSTTPDTDDDESQTERRSADADASLDALDPGAERERACAFIERTVEDADADGVVVAMSGGLDSTVTAALSVEALGSDRVYGLTLPCNKLGAPHARDAEALADALGIQHDTVHLQPLFAQFGSVAPERFDLHDEPVRSGNAVARLRMTMTYLAANATGRLVCGTSNRSERLLGYLTKYGDGGADLLPLGHLYKTDVRALAAEIDVPQFVVEKPPTAGFLPGQRDEEDLGAPYETIDRVLRLGVDRGLDPDAIVDRLASTDDVDVATVADLLAQHRATAHKRRPPSMPTAADE
ncbi:NAD+ synthase [Halorubrum laminariae]|uniref:NH(3)-dependent NAD(+) synthetase n=1 Tax=Halorubrum laminariae TaxID=1433523 RepID=A0ABD6C4R9_9EURY|nr:NAD+ synthase [Halorubrum laminariae]